MGSVVLDAVNSFFPQHSVFREAPRAHHSPVPPHQQHSSPAPADLGTTRTARPARIPSQQDTNPMSASAQRAPSSSAVIPPAGTTPSTPQRDVAGHESNTRAPSQATQSRTASNPPSPPLAARPAPPSQTSSQTAVPEALDESTQAGRTSRPRKIKVRDLEHIQSFATDDMGSFSEIRSRSHSRSRGVAEDDSPQYEISGMKVEHIIEMVAGLLTKITTTNDRQHEHLHRQPPELSGAHMTQQTNSVLAFHGKNVPSITILSYLSRINKYCPTSYEVFLSLLVYFDRMTERVNAGPMQSLREANAQAMEGRSGHPSTESLGSDGQMEGVTATTPQATQQATPPHSGGMESSLKRDAPGTPHSRPTQPDDSPNMPAEPSPIDPYNLSHFFVVDSFNIHRLVIAGVTCASKFFSDIFYTNSRYAKVCQPPWNLDART